MEHAPSLYKKLTVSRWYGFTRMQTEVARRLKRVITVSDLARQLGQGVGTTQDISLGSFELDIAKASSPSGANGIWR